MTAPVAELRQVSKSFGRGPTLVRALQGVDLVIRPGELTLIEGPSGSGKTTLLHILGLLQRADAGEVWLSGRRVDDLPESRAPDERAANVALVFQGYNLLDALTARDNVAVATLLRSRTRSGTNVQGKALKQGSTTHSGTKAQGEALGQTSSKPPAPKGGDGKAPPEITHLLDRFGLTNRADHLPSQLSGGEKQRIAIARALACPGRLVLADEPTANLDWANAQDVVQRRADLAHLDGKAVVMVSHDSRLEPFADRIVGLLNGQVSSDHVREDGPVNIANNEMRATHEVQGDPQTSAGPATRRGERRASMATRLLPWLCVIIFLVIGAFVALEYVLPLTARTADHPSPSSTDSASPYVAAAPAVVEPGTQLVALRTERRGRIKAILKRAGDRIQTGEPLVLLDDATPKALVDMRKTDLHLAEAGLAKLKAWDRPEERARVKAGVDRAQARLDRAERELRRIQNLFDRQAAPESELNTAIEEKRLAAAAVEEATQSYAISVAGPSIEETRVAEARVAQAQATVHIAETELSLHTIASPLDGHVIYRHMEPGEVVDPESPDSILSLGNLNNVHLRAEVDEADICRVRVGQRVTATAAAYAGHTFKGRVVHLEPLMGRKTIRTGRTTEQQDTKVREVLIQLAPDTPSLPIDLQMTVRFLDDAPATQAAG